MEFRIDSSFLSGDNTDRHQVSVVPLSGVISAESEIEFKYAIIISTSLKLLFYILHFY